MVWDLLHEGSHLHLLPLLSQGKFIRIHFGATGKLASADIETCKCVESPMRGCFVVQHPSIYGLTYRWIYSSILGLIHVWTPPSTHELHPSTKELHSSIHIFLPPSIQSPIHLLIYHSPNPSSPILCPSISLCLPPSFLACLPSTHACPFICLHG